MRKPTYALLLLLCLTGHLLASNTKGSDSGTGELQESAASSWLGDGTHVFGIDLGVSTVPQLMLGFDYFNLNGVGGFMSIGSNMQNKSEDDDYYDTDVHYASYTLGDEQTDSQTNQFSFSAAVNNTFWRGLGGYVGVSMCKEEEFVEFYDPYHILGSGGHYWVNGESQTSWGGVFGLHLVGPFRRGKFVTRFCGMVGYNTASQAGEFRLVWAF